MKVSIFAVLSISAAVSASNTPAELFAHALTDITGYENVATSHPSALSEVLATFEMTAVYGQGLKNGCDVHECFEKTCKSDYGVCIGDGCDSGLNQAFCLAGCCVACGGC